MLFGGRTGKGLEPVSKVGGAAINGPLLHGVGDFAGDAWIKRCAAIDGGEKLLTNVFRKVGTHGLGVEDVFAVEVDVCGCCGEVSAGVFAGDFLDSF